MNDPKERAAFINAYNNCIAVAGEDQLNEFLDLYLTDIDDNELYNKFSDVYTSIMDAICLWNDAVNFALTDLKESL